MTAVEITRFRTHPGRDAELVAARPTMLASFREDRPGFVRADLVRLPGDEWLDVVVWATSADFAASRERGGDTDAVRAFFAPIAELVSSEEGELAE